MLGMIPTDILAANHNEPTKTCTKCGETKPLSEYHKKASGRLGVMAACKACRSAAAADLYLENRESILAHQAAYNKENTQKRTEYMRVWRAANPERALESDRAWRAVNPEKKAASNRKSYENNKDLVAARGKAFRLAHPEKSAGYTRAWVERNPDKVKAHKDGHAEQTREYHRGWSANKRATDPMFRLTNSFRLSVYKSLRHGSKEGRKTFDLLGYTPADLMSHIERQFEPWMTWENWAHDTWHIDHIRPLASFTYEAPDDPDFKAAWALSNLRPLAANENMSKGSKWEPGEEAA